MEPREEIDEDHRQGRSQGCPVAFQEDPGRLVVKEQRGRIEQASDDIHAQEVSWRYQVPQSVDQPQQRSFTVREVDVRSETVHQCLAFHEEPGGVNMMTGVEQGGVWRQEQKNQERPACQHQ